MGHGERATFCQHASSKRGALPYRELRAGFLPAVRALAGSWDSLQLGVAAEGCCKARYMEEKDVEDGIEFIQPPCPPLEGTTKNSRVG